MIGVISIAINPSIMSDDAQSYKLHSSIFLRTGELNLSTDPTPLSELDVNRPRLSGIDTGMFMPMCGKTSNAAH